MMICGDYILCIQFHSFSVIRFLMFIIMKTHGFGSVHSGITSFCVLNSSFLFTGRKLLAQPGHRINLYFLFFFACKYPFVCVNEDKAGDVFSAWNGKCKLWGGICIY